MATQTQKAKAKPNSNARIAAEVAATARRKAKNEAAVKAAEVKKAADDKARSEGLVNTRRDLTGVNDLDKVSRDLKIHLGNGAAASKDFAILVHACVNGNNDTRRIAKVMGEIRFPKTGRKGDVGAFNAMRKVMGIIYPGAEIKFTASNRSYSITVKGVKPNVDALDRLDTAVYDGLQLRDSLVSRVRGEAAKVTDHQKQLKWVRTHTEKQVATKVQELRTLANAIEKLAASGKCKKA